MVDFMQAMVNLQPVQAIVYLSVQALFLTTLQSGINVGSTFINSVLFSRPYSLIKGPMLIKCWKCFHGLRIFSSFLCIFKALHSLFSPNFPSPMFIQDPIFILFVKFSRAYGYSLPYIYSGLQSKVYKNLNLKVEFFFFERELATISFQKTLKFSLKTFIHRKNSC